ncbi:MAG: thiamine phosphate synthase [Vicinamibacterales bacterium]
MRPVICLITDRRRAGGDWRQRVPLQVARAARAGVHLVQIRERDLDGGPLLGLVRRCLDAVRGTTTRVIVNDRVDVALAAGAHGVHLRADSMSAAAVRRVAPPGWLIGRSVHGIDAARAAAGGRGLDYLLFGTVFESTSKPGRPAAGLDALREVAGAVPLPVLAVGGVTRGRLDAIAAAGAAGAAGISLFAEDLL